ncbi:MAG: response regulator [Bacteroidetes bacterium]|nr:response regulator [Bacteroidota bacterium]
MSAKFKIHTKSLIIISSLLSIGLVLFIAMNANRYMAKMARNNAELYNAYRISELMKSFRSSIITLDAKQQGYQVTGDGKFLEAYKAKETETKTYLKSMEKYFSGTAEEETFYALKDYTYRKLLAAKDLSAMQTTSGSDADGSQSMDLINKTIDDINISLNATTQQLIANGVEYTDASQRWNILEIIFAVVTALTALILLFRDFNLRIKLEEELRVAKKQADDNAALKETFMANMSHEIRTPMNAIIGFSDLLRKTELGDTQKEYLSAIKNSGANLLNIINDILDFSKIGAGKLKIEKIAFDIHGLLSSLKLMFSEKASRKKIGFEIIIDKNMPLFIFGDPTRLTQILVNLVNNAIKFTDNGKVQLKCEVKSIEHDIVQLVFKIKDSGIGIPADKLSGIFERFEQANTETTRKYGGTGLGLAIVKELVDIQHGTIAVKSVEKEGSEFIVTMSYPVSYEDVDAMDSAKDLHNSFTVNPAKPLRVLLAEDNVLNQRLASTYLSGFGLQVDVAENGEIALEKLQNKKYDLLLLDIQMPVLDGYNTAERVRKVLRSEIPIIAMTAHIMVDEKEKCLSYGMNDYISKPFKEAELFQVIKKHIAEEYTTAVKPMEAVMEGGEMAVVNVKELFGIARGDNEFVKEMIGIFKKQNAEDLEILSAAIASADFDTIRVVSHRMRTSVGFMGMNVMLEPLAKMEKEAKINQDLQQILPVFELIKSQSEKGQEEINTILSTLDL